MITFKTFLQEFRSGVPQGQIFDPEVLSTWVSSSQLLQLQFVIPNKKSITIYQYDELGENDKFFILTDRVDKTDIVGYMWINNRDTSPYWQVKDVGIYPPYRKQGLGLDLYVKLVNDGFELVNGYSLSVEAEKVWRKLPQFVNVRTWNKASNELEAMNEKPKEEAAGGDSQQTFFWLATSKTSIRESLLENTMSSTYRWYLEWLAGSTTTPGTFRTAKYGELGDL